MACQPLDELEYKHHGVICQWLGHALRTAVYWRMKGPEKRKRRRKKNEGEECGMGDAQVAERRPTSHQAIWAMHSVSPREVSRPHIGK